MSDDDYMDDDEQYSDLNYTSDEQEDEPDVDIANQYYAAKEARDDPSEALSLFSKVLELEEQLGQKGEWGFKALKQMMKIHFRLQQFTEMMEKYQQLLTYIKTAVTRNYSERSISNILDYISTTNHMDVLKQFYEITLDALQEAKNDRLWFKTKLKLGKLYFDRSDFVSLTRTIRELHATCLNEDGTDDQRKGTQLLEVYALEIQMYTEQKNNKKLKQLYEKSNSVKSSAIPHPLNLGIIRECGGKMHLSEGAPKEAYACFFEAFKNYDEAGSARRIQCLKYVVLASMLMEQDYINPFDSQEIKPFRNESEIVAMTALVEAYQQKDARAFETVLQNNKASIMDDPFIRDYIEDLLKAIRTQVLVQLIKPYTRIRIPFVSEELNIPAADVESLLVALILDEKISGHIDQVNQILVLEKPVDNAKAGALDRWRKQLETLHVACINKLD